MNVNTFIKNLLFVVVVLAVLSGVTWMLPKTYGAPERSGYQAVFLANEQVYFGKLTIGGNYYVLRDVYYLQQARAPQPREEGAGPQITLVKFGEELHGPKDVMYIAKDKVLFWENLKDDGKVAQGIKTHKEQAAKKEETDKTPETDEKSEKESGTKKK